jgi:uncharacterized protein with ParB-like and HNH nuclease domain
VKTIDIKPVKIQTLLSDNFFTIPAFQRDYVWDDKNVEAYFNDIYESFDDNKSEYYLGNIVLAKEEDGRWAIVDGQQRLTTTSLFIKSFMSFINEYQMDDDKIVKKLYSVLEEMIQDFDTQTKEDLNRISFLYEENRDFMEELYKSEHDAIKQFKHRNLTKTQGNLFNAYILLFTLIEKYFYERNAELSDFLSYFMNSVLFSVVSTDDLGNALFIFQTLNDRGVGLAPTDLLKNLLLMNDKHNKTDQIVKRWKEFIDTIEAGSKLNQNIKPDRFLRHYIMAKFGKHDLKVTDVFEYIQSHKKELNIENNPLDFLADIQKRASYYVNYYQGKGRNGESLEALENMRELRFMSQLLLLMFADKMPQECFNDFCKRLENLLFVYTISGKLTKEFESLFCKWASIIANIDSEETYHTFIKENFEPEFKEQKTLFYNNFLVLSQRGQTQYRQRYILAKLDQILEHAVAGNQKLTRSEIVNANKEIEHILPQTPEDDLREEFEAGLYEEETYEDYVIKFGNLTLLPKAINIVASNHFFEDKRDEYLGENQSFKLTRAICANLKLGDNTKLNKILNYAKIEKFTTWDKNTILERQEQLAKLALLVWGFDEV